MRVNQDHFGNVPAYLRRYRISVTKANHMFCELCLAFDAGAGLNGFERLKAFSDQAVDNLRRFDVSVVAGAGLMGLRREG
jgi:hypothetical protein